MVSVCWSCSLKYQVSGPNKRENGTNVVKLSGKNNKFLCHVSLWEFFEWGMLCFLSGIASSNNWRSTYSYVVFCIKFIVVKGCKHKYMNICPFKLTTLATPLCISFI